MTISIEEFYQKNKLDNSFNEEQYLLLYPETKDFYQPYCKQNNIDDKQRLYFHYKIYQANITQNADLLYFSKYTSTSHKTIYLKPLFGLANRLLFINSAYAFAKQFGFDGISVCWENSEGFSSDKFLGLLNTSISELSVPYIDFISLEDYISNSDKFLSLENFITQDNFTLQYSYTLSKYSLFKFITHNTFCYSSFACLDYIFPDELKVDNTFLHSLSIGDNLAQRFNDYVLPENTVGVHIRKGDALRIEHSCKYSSATTQNYIDLINYVVDSDTIFLSTDCKKTQDKIIDACPAKKILTTNKPFVDTGLTPLSNKDHQDHACLDFMLLTKCKHVHGTPFSTFAKTATKITDIPFTEVHAKNLYQYCDIKLPPLSLIVGIKNRYNQLKVALMSWIIQESIDEILIIDWDSNDIDYQQLQQMDDRIRIIKIDNQPLYSHSQVLNTCVKYAKNDHILKMDVDYILNPYIKLNQWLDIDWQREFMAGSWNQNILDNKIGFIEHLNGFMCIHKKHIQNIGGYNENFTGYGWEDCELYIRLQKESGLVKIIPPISSNFVPIYHNPHMDNIRTKYQIIKDREESRISNISKTSYKSL
jgi:hypothetical protein